MRSNEVRFFSWNLAMLERSAQAPVFWDAGATEAVVRETLLQVAPNLVAFQELPGLVPYVETHGMIPANPKTHSGNLATLVDAELAEHELSVTTVDGCALLTTVVDMDLTIANVHLEAGPAAAADRLMQLVQVIRASPTKALLIVGDTNMRVDELSALTDLGFSSPNPPAYTWNSKRNRFRLDGPEFNAYFTRWIASPGVSVSDTAVHDEPYDHAEHRFWLSDHFPLSGTVTVS